MTLSQNVVFQKIFQIPPEAILISLELPEKSFGEYVSITLGSIALQSFNTKGVQHMYRLCYE